MDALRFGGGAGAWRGFGVRSQDMRRRSSSRAVGNWRLMMGGVICRRRTSGMPAQVVVGACPVAGML
jgi:hypothetical protein